MKPKTPRTIPESVLCSEDRYIGVPPRVKDLMGRRAYELFEARAGDPGMTLRTGFRPITEPTYTKLYLLSRPEIPRRVSSCPRSNIHPTRAIFFYGTRLRELCEENQELGYQLMKRIAEAAVQNQQRLMASATRETYTNK